MTWTRAMYLDQARAQADARSAQDWTDDDVRVLLGMIHAREWKRILNANRYYRTQTLTLAQDPNGQIAFSALSTGSADRQQRFYRALWATDGNRVWGEEQWAHLPIVPANVANFVAPCWYPTGLTSDPTLRAIQFVPMSPNLSMSVSVNHLPTRADQLSADTVTVEWPDDYEMVLVYETAAAMLAKGGRETGATADLQRLADQVRADMLGDIVRVSTDPVRIDFPDTSREWGSW